MLDVQPEHDGEHDQQRHAAGAIPPHPDPRPPRRHAARTRAGSRRGAGCRARTARSGRCWAGGRHRLRASFDGLLCPSCCKRAPSAAAGHRHARNGTPRPGYDASGPSASSIRSSWLYFATRSVRDGAPVLIWPQPVATARSAIVDVLGLARAMRHHRGVAGLTRHPDRRQRLRQRPDLIDLDQDRVRDTGVDPALEALRVGDEHVVADELHAVPELVGQRRPARPSRPRPSRPRSR